MCTPRISRLALLFGLLLPFLASAVLAQSVGRPTDYVSWTATAEPVRIAPGSTVRLTLTAAIDAGWKMYALDSPRPSRALEVAFDALPPGMAVPDTVTQTGAKRSFDPFFKKEVVTFERQAQVEALLTVNDEVINGEQALGATVTFQICNDRICLPPTPVPVAATVSVSGGVDNPAALVPLRAPRGEAAAPRFAPDGMVIRPDGVPQDAAIAPTADVDAARSGGLWGFLLLAVGAGLAALLTPCVFPMIPLTVSYFTKHADDQGTAVRMAVVYGLAIVVTFTGLGVLMALLVGAAGAQSFAANPWVNLFIGVVFVIFALSLLGLFELRVPSGLVNFFNRKGTETPGFTGVLFMGFTLTLVSFSCTAPFVGGLLAATTAGSWSYPILGMVVFSATFSLPFMFFALFPRALNRLPKSGSWMNAVKVVLGFVELAAALKFLSNADLVWGWGLISRTLAIALVVVIFFLAGLYLLGKLRLKGEPAVEQVSVGRLLVAIGFFGLTLYLLPGLFGAPLNRLDAYLPPRQSDDVSLVALFRSFGGEAAHDEDLWITDDIDAAFTLAEAEAKPVLIDFTGYTCTNCREMEANVFTRPEIAERFRRDFVLLRLYTDGPRDTEFQNFQLQLTGTVALPTYAVVSPSERDRPLVRLSGTVPVEQFAAFLDEGMAMFMESTLAETR